LVCEYWTAKPAKVNCKFCSVGLNLGIDDAGDKSIDGPLQTLKLRAMGKIFGRRFGKRLERRRAAPAESVM
jgi:hypothetical protein